MFSIISSQVSIIDQTSDIYSDQLYLFVHKQDILIV